VKSSAGRQIVIGINYKNIKKIEEGRRRRERSARKKERISDGRF